MVVVPTFNLTQTENLRRGASVGLLGVLVAAGVNAASDETNDRYSYQFTPVIMRAGKGSGSLPLVPVEGKDPDGSAPAADDPASTDVDAGLS